MKPLFLIGAGLVVMAGISTSVSASDEGSDWKLLGDSVVSGPNNTISVSGYDQYRDIRLCAANGPVSVRKLSIRFHGGSAQHVDRPMALASNACTGAIDLTGDKRNIERIKVSYASPVTGGSAKVTAQGR